MKFYNNDYYKDKRNTSHEKHCDKCGKNIEKEKTSCADLSECTLILIKQSIFNEKYSIDLCDSCGATLFNYLEKTGYRVNRSKS